MAIYIYPQDCSDFTDNGLGQLTPLSCTVTEESCGQFDLELEQPIDSSGRWGLLKAGCILKVLVPTRESPLYESGGETEGETSGVVTRTVYEIYGSKGGVQTFNKASASSKKMKKLKNGARINEINRKMVGSVEWMRAVIQKGGKKVWLRTKHVRKVDEVEESLWEGQCTEPRGIEREQCREQLFRIYSVEQDGESGIVTAKAMHIFYDLRATLIQSKYNVEKKTPGSEILDGVFTRLETEHEFEITVIGDALAKKIKGDYSWKNPIEAMLDPESGVVSQCGALLLRDNYDIYILPDRTRDTGVTIRRGKNLKSVVVTRDASNIVTRIIPVGKGKDGKDLYLAGGKMYVDSPRIDDYPFPYVQKIDYDVTVVDEDPDKETTFKNEDNARAKLKELAEAEFSENGVDLPTYSMEVDFVLLQNSDEYADYAALQSVYLNDSVTVIDTVLGTKSQVRVTAYEWDAIRCQYNSVTLGDIQSLDQIVYNYNIPNGTVSGSKIAEGSVTGDRIHEGSIVTDHLTAGCVTAGQIAAGSITTDHLTAGCVTADQIEAGSINAGHIQAGSLDAMIITAVTAYVQDFHAGSITADELAAALAKFEVLVAGNAYFDQATVQHLVAEAMNLEFGVGDTVYIKNLMVTYAQMVAATIGDLIIKASDGKYYHIDVDSKTGNVTATEATDVTESDIESGHKDGQTILDTNILAKNLSTANLFATYALVNQIDAARIDVDQLFAREAFITLLRTSKIVGDKSLEFLAQESETNMEQIKEATQAAQDAFDEALAAGASVEEAMQAASEAYDAAAQVAADAVTKTERATYMKIIGPHTADEDIPEQDKVLKPGVYIGLRSGDEAYAEHEAFIDAEGWFRVLQNGVSITALGPRVQELGSLKIYETAQDKGHAFI